MTVGTEPLTPPPAAPRERDTITLGALRGVYGSLAGLALGLAAWAVVLVVGRNGPPALGATIVGVAVWLPGGCAGLALTWECRCPAWARALAALGPALAVAGGLALEFLVLIGFQAHADLPGYCIGSGVVFALVGALAAASIAPALRLGSLRAAGMLVLAGAGAGLLGGLAHGGLFAASMTHGAFMAFGPAGAMISLPTGFALELACTWAGLGAAAERLQARRPQAAPGDVRPQERATLPDRT